MAQTLKATTMVETITAMVIVSIAFGIGVLVFLNVMSSPSMQQQHACIVLQEYYENMDKSLYYYRNKEEYYNGYRIISSIQPYQNRTISNSLNKKVIQISLTAFNDKNILIYKYEKVIILNS